MHVLYILNTIMSPCLKLKKKDHHPLNQKQGWSYAANWQILANFDPNFVTLEICANQVKNVGLHVGGVKS